MNPNDKKSPEVVEYTTDTLVEKNVEAEKKNKEKVDLQNEKIENDLNHTKAKVDTLINQEQIKWELWANKVDAEMTAWEKIKEKWWETAERAKRNWKWIVGWVWWFFWIRWLWNKFKWTDKKEENENNNSTTETKDSKGNTVINVDAKEKKSWWQKAFPWIVGGVGVAGAWYFFRDKLHKIPLIGKWLDETVNERLSFEEALYSVQGNILNNAKEDVLRNKLNLQWDKKNTLTVFWKEYKIDMENKKIQWLDIDFVNYEELITTIIIIWAAQYTFKWACNNNTPFSIDGGDIVLKKWDVSEILVSGRWFPWWKVLWGAGGLTLGAVLWFYLGNIPGAVVWWVWAAGAGVAAGEAYIDGNNSLSKIAPILNENKNKEKLQSYLNQLWWWESWNDEHLENKATTNNKKVNEIFVKTFETIQDTPNEHDETDRDQWEERDAYISNYQWRNNVFEMKTWSHSSYLHADIDQQGNIQSVEVEDIWIKFTWPKAVEQAIHLWSFINKCEKELAGKGRKNIAFDARLWWDIYNPGIYFDESMLWKYHRKLSKEAIEKNIPILLENNNIDTFLAWMNSRKSGWQSLWTNQTWNKGRKNTYLDNLGQQVPEQQKLLTNKDAQQNTSQAA